MIDAKKDTGNVCVLIFLLNVVRFSRHFSNDFDVSKHKSEFFQTKILRMFTTNVE